MTINLKVEEHINNFFYIYLEVHYQIVKIIHFHWIPTLFLGVTMIQLEDTLLLQT
jgi:hypothetical protein